MTEFKDAVVKLHKLVDKFEDHYREGIDNTDHYEDSLPDVEWFEQFLVFCDMLEEGYI